MKHSQPRKTRSKSDQPAKLPPKPRPVLVRCWACTCLEKIDDTLPIAGTKGERICKRCDSRIKRKPIDDDFRLPTFKYPTITYTR